MTDFSSAFGVAASGMRSQAQRLQHVSENIANADTPGYRRKVTTFEADRGPDATAGAVRPGPVSLDRRDLPRIFDPGHPMADGSGHYLGSNVDMVVEIADARAGAAQLRGQSARLRSGAADVVIAQRSVAPVTSGGSRHGYQKQHLPRR
jgi:flagellar basal-body rod protein FlgC